MCTIQNIKSLLSNAEPEKTTKIPTPTTKSKKIEENIVSLKPPYGGEKWWCQLCVRSYPSLRRLEQHAKKHSSM